jgi:hypothetical protein
MAPIHHPSQLHQRVIQIDQVDRLHPDSSFCGACEEDLRGFMFVRYSQNILGSFLSTLFL